MLVLGCAKSSQDASKGGGSSQGAAGASGTSCSVVAVSPGGLAPYGGAMITCGDTSTIISNGAPGAAATTYSIVAVIDPCADAPGIYDEVLLRTGNGSLIASFSDNSNGNNTRLSVIPDGSYQVTDGSGCNFTVSTAGTTRTVSWTGGSVSWSL